MQPVTIEAAAAVLHCSSKTVRYQLARAAAAGKPFARKHAAAWLLFDNDLPALREWMATARATSGFQDGNKAWQTGKKVAKRKKTSRTKAVAGKRLRRDTKKTSTK